MKRIATIAVAIIAIAFMGWSGTKQYRNRREQRKHAVDCEGRNAEFAGRVDAIKRDANEELKIGTKKAAVSQFFVGHNIPFSTASLGGTPYAIGTLYLTGGCAPLGCGADNALIGVRVKIDADGTVIGTPEVVDMYVDCV